MKNIKDIDSTIKELLDEIEENNKRETQHYDASLTKKNTSKIVFLRKVRIYLEHNPREQFVRSEFERLDRLITHANNSWAEFYDFHKATFDKLPQESITKRKNEFLKDIPMAEYKSQLKTLDYLLN